MAMSNPIHDNRWRLERRSTALHRLGVKVELGVGASLPLADLDGPPCRLRAAGD